MLQIRLRKGSGSDGSASKPVGSENVTVACPEHLVLAELPVAKGLVGVSGVKVVKTVGRRCRRQLGDKVHFCVRCNFPIAIYGRLSPCLHAFCLTCARSDSSCYLCDERIHKIQTIKMLDGIFVCAAPHCLRSFLKRIDFELHIKETHSDLLQPLVEKDETRQKNVKPVASDSQPKQPMHAQSQVLTCSPSASSALASQQHRDNSEDQSLRSQPKGALLSTATSHHVETHFQQHQYIGSSSGAKQQEQEQHSKQQTQQGPFGFQWQSHQQHAHHSDTGASSHQQYPDKQQGLERAHNQSDQEKHHRQSHGRRHQHERHQWQDTDQYHQQQLKSSQHEEINQGNPPSQAMLGNQPDRQFSPIPSSFPNQPLQHPYPMQLEGQPQQQHNANYGTTSFGPLVPGQPAMPTFQDNNQKMHMQGPIIPDFQESHPKLGYLGHSGQPYEATTAFPGPQGGYMPPHWQRAFDFPAEYVQGPVGMPLPLQPEGVEIDPNQSSYSQNVPHGPHITPPPKRGKFQNMPPQVDPGTHTQNNEWGGVVSNFPSGHGYGGWSSTS